LVLDGAVFDHELILSPRHSLERGNPGFHPVRSWKVWIPAFAGMTRLMRRLRLNQRSDVVNFFMQVAPFRVHFFDEVEFPVSVPFFQLFLAADGGFHGVVVFVPDEDGDAVFGAEAVEGF
jgi:hypothetical protein